MQGSELKTILHYWKPYFWSKKLAHPNNRGSTVSVIKEYIKSQDCGGSPLLNAMLF